jgi:kynurenine formamidase
MLYNGHPARRVNTWQGASVLAVTDLPGGIVTRGVLIDIPRLLGAAWVDSERPVFPYDIVEAEAAQGVQVRRGDMVVLYVGEERRKRDELAAVGVNQSGFHAACLPLLHEREVAAIGADTANDFHPSGYRNIAYPVHSIGISKMGLFLIDNMNLAELATVCAQLGQWEFLIIVSPLRLEGVTGSPVNPLAIF